MERILYNISIGERYFSYFLKYVFLNYTKIPLRVINICYSLFWCVVSTLKPMFTSIAVFEFQECGYNYITM